ncbi:MAG: hypothetical protein HXL39_03495, partial [Schaalia sp.]|nr:hypothetical protein [Schaalia sp.]
MPSDDEAREGVSPGPGLVRRRTALLYYLTGSGAMATGWVRDGGSWYYLSD